MIKAVGGEHSERLYILGLSRLNVQKLQEGKPIVFDADELGLGIGRFVIMFGETEEAIAEALGVPVTQ